MDQKIYVGQTALQIQADTQIDLSSGVTFIIKYIAPDQSTGSWPCSIVSGSIIGTDSAPILSEGLWKCWAHVTFNDATFAPGDPFTFFVYTEGQ